MYSVACPNCQKRLKLSAEQLKRKLRCPSCPTRFIVGGQTGARAGGMIEYLGIEVFEEEVAEDFEIVEEKNATTAVANTSSDEPSGPVYADNVLPDEFGLIDDEPPRREVQVEAPLPKAKPIPAQKMVRAKPLAAPRPVPPPVPKAKPIPPPKAPTTPPPQAKRSDLFDLGDEDTAKMDIHLEMRTPEAVPPPAPIPPPPLVPKAPPVPRPALKKPAAPPPAPEFDNVEVIEEGFEIPGAEVPPSVRTTKSGIPIVEAASDDEIAEYEARQAAQRRQQPPRRR